MKKKQMTRVARLAASTVLAAAVSPVLAQDGTTESNQGRAVTPYGHLPTPSVFKPDTPKPQASASAAEPAHQETLPPPRPADGSPATPDPGASSGSPSSDPVNGAAQPMSRWQKFKGHLWYCLGLEPELQSEPLGASVDATYRNHVANGIAAGLVLYRYDFVDNTANLNTRGQDQVARIAALLAHNGYVVIVERLPSNPKLAEARRLAVLNQLLRSGIRLPPERVVIGAPIANGLRGVEAEVIYQNLLSQTHERGLVTGAASGFVGAATTSPGGGGGIGGGVGGGTGTPPPPP
jgi:hypothetical protein